MLIFISVGCSNKKVTITTEYIINENWSKKAEEKKGNLIEVGRM